MRKIVDIVCLVIWSLNLVYAIGYVISGTLVNPILVVCPVLVCILHYAEALIRGNYD